MGGGGRGVIFSNTKGCVKVDRQGRLLRRTVG